MKPNDSVFPQSPGPSAIARKMATFASLLLGGFVGAAEKPQPMPLPPVTVRHKDGEYGAEKWAWEGAASVRDPINRVTLFLGGRVGGVEFGSIGNWALADDGKTWSEIKSQWAILDPLRNSAVTARGLAKDGEAAARNVFYGALDPAHEATAIEGEPAKLIGAARKLADALSKALLTAKADGWQQQSIEHARGPVESAAAMLQRAQAGFTAGKLDAKLLRDCFDAQWALDEAADCLASSPGPREQPAAAYDPASQCVVLFGGNHGDYALADTWIYECARKRWRRAWPKSAPSPRFDAKMRWNSDRQAIVLDGGSTMLNKMVYQVGEMPASPGEWLFDTKQGEWHGGGAVAERQYRTIVQGYDPRWYDAAPRGDAQATGKWLDQLVPNTWTAVAIQPAPAPEREWGTAVFDPDRDQIYRWSGGHQADPSTLVSTYHPAINRWSIPYVAEILFTASRKGMTFNGRPDCANHTYLHYAYDPVSRRLVCVAMGGTCIYNPDRRDFDFSIAQPFNRQIYETCTVSTPRGVVAWVHGYFGILDVGARRWKTLPVASGKLPPPMCDGSAICYDSKRDVLWLASFLGYQRASGNIWRYDMKTGDVTSMSPANSETIGKAKGFNREIRESVYLPPADVVLYSNFVAGGEVAYDPQKNRWATLNIPKKLDRQGTVSDTLVYDAKRGIVWDLNAYKSIYVLKVDPKSLVLSNEPGK
jgi:hypothetical protein